MKHVITNSVCRTLVFIAVILISSTEADFPCYCNYNVEASVYSNPDSTSSVLGYMYEFDCKSMAAAHGAHKGFYPIQFQGQLGYIATGPTIRNQTCPGSPLLTDIITTTSEKPHGHSTTTQLTTTTNAQPITSATSKPTTTRTTQPTTTSTTQPTTTTTIKPTTTSTTQPMTSTTTQPTTSTTTQPMTSIITQQMTLTSTQPTTTSTTQPITSATTQPKASTTTQPTTTTTTKPSTSTTTQPSTTTTQRITLATTQPTTTTTTQPTTTTSTPTVTWPGLTLTSTEYTTTPSLYWSMAANVSGTPLQYVGIGYNLLTGNPLLGRDPGLLLDKRILQLTGSSSEVREASVSLNRTCHNDAVTRTLVHGSQSLQKEMKTLVQPSSTHQNSLTVHAFVYNFVFNTQRAYFENANSVYHDSLTTCKFGSAQYQGNSTAPFGNFSVSRNFAKAVCKLSSANTTTFKKFLDEWGTSVVLSVDLGTKTLYRSRESTQQIFQNIQATDPTLLVHSGPFNGYSSSLTINEQTYSTSSTAQQSSTQNLIMTAGGTIPVPVGLTIVPISDIIRSEYFASVFDILVADKSCPDSIYSGDLDTISAKVTAALKNYNADKQYETHINQVLTDHGLQIPVTWPRGTYGLMKTASGCPGEHVSWLQGSRFQDTEDISSKNSFPSDITRFLAGSFASNNIQTEFCIKSQFQVSEYDGNWPRGAYCLLKKGNCPTGFQSGSIYWDDESLFNKNSASGTLPDGDYESNTRIYYCCRNDGPTSSQIILPNERPFVLLRYGMTCQNVHSMQMKELSVYWDDDDLSNSDSASGMHPYDDGGGDDHRLHFCYYQKSSPGTSIVG